MKKNYALVVIILCMFSFKGYSQDSIIADLDYTLLDKYISAAKAYYPRRKVVNEQARNAKTSITLANLQYLNLFSANYIYRPNGNVAVSVPGLTSNPYNVNGMQYNIALNLGSFLSTPFNVKKAKSEYKVAQLQALDYEISLVADVKKRYYSFIQATGVLKVRTQTAQDNKSTADVMRRRFEKGEVGIDTYNASRVLSADANTSKIQSEVDYLNAKDALEEIIGKKLSEVK